MRSELEPARRAPLVTRLITLAAAFQRPMTLGVRGLVVGSDNRVLLVRHTYVGGFYLPGGGVEPGETLAQSLARELEEEGNIALRGEPMLHGVYFNRRASKRDHVALYVVRDFSQSAPRLPDIEIAEAGFFPADALPAETTPSTRARIEEILFGGPPSHYW
jgi:8-oxo-dGTP pyrophosphatase MutT (NUDIX family)